MNRLRRWEHGSDFNWPFFYPSQEALPPVSWEKCGQYYGSGRDALRALLLYGKKTRGWRRLWIPSYFCQDVITSILLTGITVKNYNDGPELTEPDISHISWQKGDVLMVVNYFGLRIKPSLSAKMPGKVELIEDHTHDPFSGWARESLANWCFASLRKTLPLGSGGILWSPARLPLPPASSVSLERHVASLEKNAAMLLKTLYLEGYPVEKDVFRRLQLSGEDHIASGAVSGMPEWEKILIAMFPADLWRKQRHLNYLKFLKALKGTSWLRVLKPGPGTDACPFMCILKFDIKERRDFICEHLISARIYPAILWPLEGVNLPGVRAEEKDFSRRMLAIHCDMRYSEDDMEKVASLIKQAGTDYDA